MSLTRKEQMMIYEWGSTIVHIGRSICHFFRALFCKDYFTDSHGLGECRVTHHWGEYQWCPKREGADNEKSV